MILQEIFEERAAQEALLRWKHKWADIFYNWVITCVVVAMFFSFGQWGMDIHNRNTFAAGQQDALATIAAGQAAQQEAEAEAEKKRQEEDAALQIQEAQALARMLFGVRNFTAKYHYSTEDLITYAYCPVNRALATGKTIMEVLREKDQFLAYSEHNDLDTELSNLMLQFVADLHAGRLKQCDTKFRYAVFTDMGIFLVDDPNKPVPERWHV